jgi:hypothetical protein
MPMAKALPGWISDENLRRRYALFGSVSDQ